MVSSLPLVLAPTMSAAAICTQGGRGGGRLMRTCGQRRGAEGRSQWCCWWRMGQQAWQHLPGFAPPRLAAGCRSRCWTAGRRSTGLRTPPAAAERRWWGEGQAAAADGGGGGGGSGGRSPVGCCMLHRLRCAAPAGGAPGARWLPVLRTSELPRASRTPARLIAAADAGASPPFRLTEA